MYVYVLISHSTQFFIVFVLKWENVVSWQQGWQVEGVKVRWTRVFLPFYSVTWTSTSPKLSPANLRKPTCNYILPKLSAKLSLLLWYASFYFTMFFIFVEFPVVVYFVLLEHCLHLVKNFIGVMDMVYASMWIRIGQWIHVYDVKSRFAHGRHWVGVEEGNSLKGEKAKMFYWGFKKCLSLSLSKR